METTNLTFHRLNLSPYQSKSFPTEEKRQIQGLGITYNLDPYDSHILISNTHTDFKKSDLDLFKKIELIIHPNSGYDNFSADFVKAANFPIVTGNTIRSHAVTEYILGKLFTHFSSIENQANWDIHRRWDRVRLIDQEVLILGHGEVGSLLEKALTPLVKKVHISDPFKNKAFSSLNKVSVVLVAAGLNKTSRNLINKDFLGQLQENWVLINAARGKIINQTELLKVLNENKSATAYLDVFESEPYQDGQFNKLENLVTSSHIAGVSKSLDQLIIKFELEVLSNFLTHRLNISSFLKLYPSLILKNKLSQDKSFLI